MNEAARCRHRHFGVHLLWVFRFFKWRVFAGCNGSDVTRIEWGRIG